MSVNRIVTMARCSSPGWVSNPAPAGPVDHLDDQPLALFGADAHPSADNDAAVVELA